MAQKRMFTMKIVDSDAFLDMPATTQCLYFHLNMRADDDGFIGNPKRIMKITGASEDDLRLLIAKRFVLTFEDGVIVIKHWRMHNTLSRDRYTETSYIDEKRMLLLKENGSYSLASGNVIDDTKLIERSNRQTHNRRNKGATKAHAEKDIGLDKDIDIDKDKNKSISKKSPRHKHGEYQNVLLSDDDLEKLKAEFPSDWDQRIQRLSEYMASSGKSYKNHLATIRNWARRDKPAAKHAGGEDMTDLDKYF